MRAPRGDGHPVLALPGFLASDLSMAPMRRYLSELGYDAHAWQMGRNTRGLMQMRAGLRDRLSAIHATTGRKVSIIGWSPVASTRATLRAVGTADGALGDHAWQSVRGRRALGDQRHAAL